VGEGNEVGNIKDKRRGKMLFDVNQLREVLTTGPSKVARRLTGKVSIFSYSYSFVSIPFFYLIKT
jgi:hypothetical protein